MKTLYIAFSVLTSFTIHDAVYAEHGDILLLRDPEGALVTGTVDVDAGGIVDSVNTRVFSGEFDPFFATDEPGFNALGSGGLSQLPIGYDTLPGNTDLTFTGKAFDIEGMTANLFYWDAVGDPAFTPALGTTLTISKAPAIVFHAELTGADTDVDGFVIDTTSSDGFLHKHIDFILTADGGDPAEGIYVWALTASADTLESWTIFFVHAAGDIDEAQHEAAASSFMPNCSADISGDGQVTTTDLTALLGTFGQSVPPGTIGDFTGDGQVTTSDLTILLGQFGCIE